MLVALSEFNRDISSVSADHHSVFMAKKPRRRKDDFGSLSIPFDKSGLESEFISSACYTSLINNANELLQYLSGCSAEKYVIINANKAKAVIFMGKTQRFYKITV